MRRLILVPALLALLAACDIQTPTQTPSPKPVETRSQIQSRAKKAAAQFIAVVNVVEPVAERECRQRTRGLNCDFLIVVDDRRGMPANAFQTLDPKGRPIIAFTIPLILDVRNKDELAFIMSHEAAHHIRGHIARQRENATTGAVILGGLTSLGGGNSSAVERAVRLGATLGGRAYSKDFELEADALGTIIATKAGFNALRGAEFFTRIPDPGNRFLGTHPPNAQRIDIVRRTLAAR